MKNSLSATSIITLIFIVLVALIILFTKKTATTQDPRIIANPQPTPIASEPLLFYPNEGKE